MLGIGRIATKTDFENSEIGIGSPLTELKINKFTKKGMDVHIGFQEDIGGSVAVFYNTILGVSFNASFKTQLDVSWKW